MTSDIYTELDKLLCTKGSLKVFLTLIRADHILMFYDNMHIQKFFVTLNDYKRTMHITNVKISNHMRRACKLRSMDNHVQTAWINIK